MGELVLKEIKLYYDKYDLTAKHNKIKHLIKSEPKDITDLACDSRERLAGMKSFELEHTGYYQAGTGQPDEIFFTDLGVSDKIATICPTGGSDGEVAYFNRGVSLKYEPGGKIGDVVIFNGAMFSQGDPIVRGTVMGTGAKTATGNGTARQIGALSSETMYAAIHVTAVSGTTPTLDVKIQSDNNGDMSSPTDRITFTQMSEEGSQWGIFTTDTTDTYWRAVWTIGGGTPSFTLVISIGKLAEVAV